MQWDECMFLNSSQSGKKGGLALSCEGAQFATRYLTFSSSSPGLNRQ